MIYSTIYKAKDNNMLVIFSHGIGEHQGIYETFKNALVHQGINVLLYDIRGHGKSESLKPYKTYQVFIDDLSKLVSANRQTYKKIFLIGHSFGSIISNLYAVLKDDIDGVISIGYQYKIIKIVKYLGFFLPFKSLKFNWADEKSRHEKSIEEINDPLLLKSINFRWLYQTLYKANNFILKHTLKKQMPYLILHGGSDKIVDPNNACYFYEHLKSNDKSIIIYPNSYHDLLLDIDKEIVVKDIILFLKAHM